MLLAKDIAAVKVAIETCNNPELKREILCSPGSDYDRHKKSCQYDRKQQWDEIVEIKTGKILKSRNLPEKLQKNVTGVVLSIGMRMLTWAEYHEGTLGFSRDYSINFLKSSIFTQHGIIDCKKAAEELMKDESLSIRQKYKLACLYCFRNRIYSLYKQMTKEDKQMFYDAKEPERIQQPGLVKIWSYTLMGNVNKLCGDIPESLYLLDKVVESGSKAAVEYVLEIKYFRDRKGCRMFAAVEAVKNRKIRKDDWIVFRDERYDDRNETWVPSDYYVDILWFLLSKMEEDQQIKFLKKDIKGVCYRREPFEDRRRSRVLEFFLNWPYQAYFMRMVKPIREFLPRRDYAVLLLRICDKIESRKWDNLKYGEEKSYDFRGLLKEFWCQSPERYKRYVFSNQKVTYMSDGVVELKAGVELLFKLLTLKYFTYEDRKNIGIILDSATDKEREILLFSEEWIHHCIEKIEEEKWEILDRIVLNCFSSKEEVDKFKRELSFTKETHLACIYLFKYGTWNAAESFIKWSSLPEEQINQLKREIIYSEAGQKLFRDLVLYKEDVEEASKIFKWFFTSEDDVREFKKEYMFSDIGLGSCATLVTKGKLEVVDKFTNWCLSSEEEIKELKQNLVHSKGNYVCKSLISLYKEENICDEGDSNSTRTIKNIEGCRWEQVEKFLTWCFSSEKDISVFKKNELLKVSGKDIHFNLVKSNQWEEAERFFAWLSLSAEEIKELKKDTIFNHGNARDMFSELIYSKEGDEIFVDYGSKEEAIELLLRWYLTDKETVLEFKDEFKQVELEYISEEGGILKYFDTMIEQRLRDIDEEVKGAKRKSEVFSSNKRLCNLKLENREINYVH